MADDLWPSIAQWLAPRAQLWRADLRALGRLAGVCRAARAAFALSPLRAREAGRRARVACARRLLAEGAPFFESAVCARMRGRLTIRVHVAFNGRIRIREAWDGGPSATTGITVAPDGGGRALTVHQGRSAQLFGATFTDLEGLLGALRHAWWHYFHDQANLVHHDGARVFASSAE